jgi:hypothetical protein
MALLMASLMSPRSINDAGDAIGELPGTHAVFESRRRHELLRWNTPDFFMAAANLVLMYLPEGLRHRTDAGVRFIASTYDLPFGPNGQCSCIPRAFLMNASAQQFDGFASTRVFMRMREVYLDQ